MQKIADLPPPKSQAQRFAGLFANGRYPATRAELIEAIKHAAMEFHFQGDQTHVLTHIVLTHDQWCDMCKWRWDEWGGKGPTTIDELPDTIFGLKPLLGKEFEILAMAKPFVLMSVVPAEAPCPT